MEKMENVSVAKDGKGVKMEKVLGTVLAIPGFQAPIPKMVPDTFFLPGL
jgi:hypothetical protein